MQQLHCGTCGGLISDLSKVSYRLPSRTLSAPAGHGDPCGCPVPVIYGPPAGFASIPAMPAGRVEPGAKVSRGPKRGV